MSKGHTAVREFLEEKVRFADFFNGNLFQGQQMNYFGSVDNTTYQVIGELLQSEQILNQEVRVENSKGGKDVCKALDDLYQDGVHQGLHYGIIKTARKYGATNQEIIKQLIEEFQINETEAEELLNNFKAS